MVGWRHSPPTRDLVVGVLLCGDYLDARGQLEARVQKREYPAGGLNSLGQITVVSSVIFFQETLKKYSIVFNPRELLLATGEDCPQ